MAGYFSGGAPSEAIEDINRILLMAGLPPVRSLANIPLDSDAGLALQTYRSTLRAQSAKGWWFNTNIRQWFDPVADAITINGALSAKTSACSPGDDYAPETRLELQEGAPVGLLKNLDDDNYTFTVGLYLDLILAVDDDNLPTTFKEYCIYKAGRQFAGYMGLKVDTYDEELAWDALQKAESENMERANLLTDNPDNLSTWYR